MILFILVAGCMSLALGIPRSLFAFLITCFLWFSLVAPFEQAVDSDKYFVRITKQRDLRGFLHEIAPNLGLSSDVLGAHRNKNQKGNERGRTNREIKRDESMLCVLDFKAFFPSSFVCLTTLLFLLCLFFRFIARPSEF